MKNLRLFSIGGCSEVAFAVTQKHLSGSRLHRENAFALRSNGSFATLFVLFCSHRKGQPLSSKLFLFERKSYKKKQKPFRFIDGAESFGIPFDVLFSRLSHGVRTQKLPSSEFVAVSLCAKITFGTNFQFAMDVHPP